MVQYKKYTFPELMDIAEKHCSYNFDGDPTGRGNYSDGILLALNYLGKQEWEFVLFSDYNYFFKQSIFVIDGTRY